MSAGLLDGTIAAIMVRAISCSGRCRLNAITQWSAQLGNDTLRIWPSHSSAALLERRSGSAFLFEELYSFLLPAAEMQILHILGSHRPMPPDDRTACTMLAFVERHPVPGRTGETITTDGISAFLFLKLLARAEQARVVGHIKHPWCISLAMPSLPHPMTDRPVPAGDRRSRSSARHPGGCGRSALFRYSD